MQVVPDDCCTGSEEGRAVLAMLDALALPMPPRKVHGAWKEGDDAGDGGVERTEGKAVLTGEGAKPVIVEG